MSSSIRGSITSSGKLFEALERLELRATDRLSSRHKPLTLLWAAGRFLQTGERLVLWTTFRDDCAPILKQYGSPLPKPDPRYPFWELISTPLWEFISDEPNPRAPAAPTMEWLDSRNPSAGLTKEAAELLSDSQTLNKATSVLIDRFLAGVDGEVLRSDLRLHPVPTTTVPNGGSTRTARAKGGAGFIADAKLRRALEIHAVTCATSFYQSEGWTVEDVGAVRSYDLHLTNPRGMVRHVEVKGSSQDADLVELTKAEVAHSRDPTPCDLFVVNNIASAPTTTDYRTWGGHARIWRDWSAEDTHLQATRYRYRLPHHSDAFTLDASVGDAPVR